MVQLEHRPIVVGLGELLWDMLPLGKQLGGATANFAWHAAQLGAHGILASAVGADEMGHEAVATCMEAHLDIEFIARLPEWPTGTVSVTLDIAGQPDYIIQTDVAWDHIPWDETLSALANRADAVCVGTLAQRAPGSRTTVQRFLDSVRPECLTIFDVNFRQDYYSRDVLHETLTKTSVMKINEEELPVVAFLLGLPQDPEDAVRELIETYELDLVAVTRGAAGSILYTEDAGSYLPGRGIEVKDTIGAGDSFTAALAVGILLELPLERTHRLASEVAAFVCSRSGGMPLLSQSLKRAARRD